MQTHSLSSLLRMRNTRGLRCGKMRPCQRFCSPATMLVWIAGVGSNRCCGRWKEGRTFSILRNCWNGSGRSCEIRGGAASGVGFCYWAALGRILTNAVADAERRRRPKLFGVVTYCHVFPRAETLMKGA